MAANKKRLVRSRTNRLVGGVLGGIAEYFNWNANLLRLIYVLVSIAMPFVHVVGGLLVYVLLMTFIPLDDTQTTSASFRDLFGGLGGGRSTEDTSRKDIHATEQDVHEPHTKDGE
ncbi:MAG TPA: PspC domain-containing protein [Candidatus Levilactobacillus faecigallinarum]|uniref:PspC domain-containing protein n=1 Tax=Candidatus Levilactobacillus faecigallinarum TaxID=2838638 RepID=A0A9D1QSQ4_9LACO|nr:PspC domain-containing protein [Candidatus Levilactobacillus faecigallinarum]